ncbi:MAG: CDP-alcohol phosphatidyltransferase family protein [Labilithrix sp.]|nr:CDP-alcohol phosphatidyltransferase family protein [Labilithrix sp.]MCW5813275.1 CDP-alcohol phosphatidyltransferase family protein [Labilithrix sp.]
MSVYAARDLVRVPGLISFTRLPLAVVFAAHVRNAPIALGALALAGLSDVLDGWVARRFHQETPAGAVLDAVTDKLFVGVVAVALVVSGALTLTEALLLGVRDVGELAIALRLAAKDWHTLFRPHPHAPFGKLTTLLQFGAVIAAVVRWPGLHVLAGATAIAGVLATVSYWRAEGRTEDRIGHA